MTPKEAVVLVRYVKACCPAQQMDEFTPDAWHDLLGDLSLSDCRQAVAGVARHQPFVSPAEVRAEVRLVRLERIQDAGIPAPPAGLLDDGAAYKACIRAATRAIADGKDPAAAMQAVAAKARRELEAS